jgi:hypothetical protein
MKSESSRTASVGWWTIFALAVPLRQVAALITARANLLGMAAAIMVMSVAKIPTGILGLILFTEIAVTQPSLGMALSPILV